MSTCGHSSRVMGGGQVPGPHRIAGDLRLVECWTGASGICKGRGPQPPTGIWYGSCLTDYMHHRRPRRLSADDYRGPNRYSLTFCTADRQRHFTSAPAVDLVLGEFRYTAAHEGYAILVYCFMEDHVHLLVETESETADLQRFVKLMKQRSAFRFQQAIRAATLARELFRPDAPIRRGDVGRDAVHLRESRQGRVGQVTSGLSLYGI